jgi:hypothetical protein
MDPSIFTAFREQLKLKPESQKGPFEIFESNVLKGLQKIDEDRRRRRCSVRREIGNRGHGTAAFG